MKFSRKSILACLLVLGLSPLCMAQAAPAGGNPPPTKLAVVNVVDLFDGLLEKQAADQQIDKMKRDFEDKSSKLSDEIQNLQKGLSAYKAGTKEFMDAQDELLNKTMGLQAFNSFAQQKLFLELRIRTADIYRKINEAVAEYAAANGIALVFVADNPSVEGARTQEQLQAMVTVRKILYFHPDFDITGKIKLAMNTKFSLGAGATAPKP